MKRSIPALLLLCAAAPLLFSQGVRLRLATTTSTLDSGLLNVLNPPFEKLTGITVDVIAVGSGKAIALGQNGDVDVLLVHERAAEDKFIAQGYGVNRRDVMHNDFVVVGPPDEVSAVCRKLREHPLAPWEPVNGSGLVAADVVEEARRRGVELVVLVGPEISAGALAGDLAALLFSGVPVVVASEVWAWLDGRLPVAELSPAAFLHQPGFGVIHWELFNRVTRVVDVALSSILLVLATPVVALAGVAVLLFDGRPVFYLQTRVGQFGRHFRVVKLRTMRPDAEEGGPAFAVPRDPRVTRVGHVLRRVRVDELPQLLNVLRGDMSLVGPRPERPEFVARLAQTVPYYTFRLAVPPGLTGWAQVNMPYARSEEEHRRKLEYDLYFIRERSFGMYLLTLLRTASVTLVGARR